MKNNITYSIIFVAMSLFMMIAPNHDINAQPASFTADFLQEDYRGGEVVRTNTVTVVWDAETELLTFKNFYWNYAVVNNVIIDLVFPRGGTGNSSPTSLTWESNTKASFGWKVSYMGVTNIYSYYHYACISNFRSGTSYTSYDPVTHQKGTVNYGYYGSQECNGTIDLEKGEITIDDPWGCMIGYSSSSTWTSMSSSCTIEYFERSKMTIIRTDLVDIVNDGTLGEEYNVYDDLIGVTTIDGVQSSPVKLSANTNTFKMGAGKYKLDLDVSASPYTLTISQTAENFTTSVDNGSHSTYYIIGEVNENSFNPTVGQPMVTTDGSHYSAVVNFDGRNEGYNYFSITNVLAENNDEGGWNYVNNNNHRFGPSSNNYSAPLDVLFAKDLGKYKYPSVISDGQIDFMGIVDAEYQGELKVHPAADYDQSNWVMLTGLADANYYVGKIIKGQSIKGVLTDKLNPAIAVTSTPVAGDASTYEANLYIMPSFNGAYYESTNDYFFVAPKPQEYSYITWACYANDDNFYVPAEGNTRNLSGGMSVCWDYFPTANPQFGYIYEFDAIVRKVESTVSSAPRLMDEGTNGTPKTDVLSADYLVYPLRLYDVPTAIETVETAVGKVVDVKYYNIMGVESTTPFSGINIVVSTYDDGTNTTSKQLYK